MTKFTPIKYEVLLIAVDDTGLVAGFPNDEGVMFLPSTQLMDGEGNLAAAVRMVKEKFGLDITEDDVELFDVYDENPTDENGVKTISAGITFVNNFDLEDRETTVIFWDEEDFAVAADEDWHDNHGLIAMDALDSFNEAHEESLEEEKLSINVRLTGAH
jgi:hypothetical protein